MAEPLEEESGGRVVFRGTRWDKWLYSGMLIFFSALYVGWIFSPGKGGQPLRWSTGVMIAAMLWLAYRGRKLGSIEADVVGVRVFGAVRSWKWSWPDVSEFGAKSMSMPFMVGQRQVLVVSLVGSEAVKIRAVNSPLQREGDPAWLNRAVDALNLRRRAVGSGDAGK